MVSLHSNKINLHKNKNYKLIAFLLGIAITIIPFMLSMFQCDGLFMYMGDFNAQQIPFYQHAHDLVLSGTLGWDSYTDLGSNFIGSYSFYLLGSPFFWFTLLFPSSAVPYLVGPLLMLKFGCASLTSYMFLERHVKDNKFALIGALLYAFSGFAVSNIFYNHFHEAIVFFPLLLYALEEYVYKDRKGLFAFIVCLCATVNYYFFVGQVAFVIIYWFVSPLSKACKIRSKRFWLLAFEAVIGFLMSLFIVLPSILAIMGNSRLSSSFSGWGFYIYENAERYIAIITSFLFPNDLQYYENIAPNAEGNWSSIAAWLPLFGFTGILALLKNNRKSWICKLIGILLLFALIPVLNSIFQLFNPVFYTRWFYMFTLVLSLGTITALENYNIKDWKTANILSSVFTLGIICICLFTPTTDEKTKETSLGLCKYPTIFIFSSIIAILSLVFIWYIYIRIKNKKLKKAKNIIIASVSFISIVCLIVTIFVSIGDFLNTYTKDNVINKEIPLSDSNVDNYRIDVYQGPTNLGLFSSLHSINCFHSIVPSSIQEFYSSLGENRNVVSNFGTKEYGIESFLSVKYLFTSVESEEDSNKDIFAIEDTDPVFNDNGKILLPSWSYYKKENNMDIYTNDNYVSMGFYYDGYITKQEFEKIPEADRHLVYLKAIILTEEQSKIYSKRLKHLDIRDFEYSDEQYNEDCKNLQKNTCNNFNYSSSGFNAKISTSEDKLVLFSVPYEEGWSATVNGTSVQIEKVSNGFMAINIPAKEDNDIVFTYNTPGLNEGIIISSVSFILFLCYIIISRFKNKNKKKNHCKHIYKISKKESS